MCNACITLATARLTLAQFNPAEDQELMAQAVAMEVLAERDVDIDLFGYTEEVAQAIIARANFMVEQVYEYKDIPSEERLELRQIE